MDPNADTHGRHDWGKTRVTFILTTLNTKKHQNQKTKKESPGQHKVATKAKAVQPKAQYKSTGKPDVKIRNIPPGGTQEERLEETLQNITKIRTEADG